MHHVASLFAPHQVRLPEHGQVLRDGRLADLERPGDGVDAQRSARDQPDNLQANRNRERFVQPGQLFLIHKYMRIDL